MGRWRDVSVTVAVGVTVPLLVAVFHPEDASRIQISGRASAADPARGEDGASAATQAGAVRLEWRRLPPLPDPIGVAGPFVGVHGGGLIVAGGANFAAADAPGLWEAPKRYHTAAHVLSRTADGSLAWRSGFALERPAAYGACVSTPVGVVCVGGDDGARASSAAFLLTWRAETATLAETALPKLPVPSTAGGAALVGRHVYVVAGLASPDLESAGDRLWRLDISADAIGRTTWEELPRVPGGFRGYPLVAAQFHGADECLYVLGGRRQRPGTQGPAGIEVLADLHEFSPARFAADPGTGWRRRSAAPTPLMAGTACGIGRSHVVVLAADDGSLLASAAADPTFVRRHPGFPRRAWAYDTAGDFWEPAGETPACQVTTPAAVFDGGVAVVSGEVRPRVRSTAAWRIEAVTRAGGRGAEVPPDSRAAE